MKCIDLEKIEGEKEMKMKEVKFKSIREIAKTGLISEYYLRAMVKKGDCPGIKSGKKFLINEVALIEKLDAMSREADADEDSDTTTT